MPHHSKVIQKRPGQRGDDPTTPSDTDDTLCAMSYEIEQTFSARYGRRLGQALARKGMKPTTLARRLGVDVTTVRRWIRGEFVPHYEVALRVQKALDWPTELRDREMA